MRASLLNADIIPPPGQDVRKRCEACHASLTQANSRSKQAPNPTFRVARSTALILFGADRGRRHSSTTPPTPTHHHQHRHHHPQSPKGPECNIPTLDPGSLPSSSLGFGSGVGRMQGPSESPRLSVTSESVLPGNTCSCSIP
jgi:hypothetical protein